MTSFPIVLIPRHIQQARLELPPTPPFPYPSLPQIQTVPPIKKLNKRFILGCFVANISLSFLVCIWSVTPSIGILCFIILGSVIGFYVVKEVKSYPLRQKERDLKVRIIDDLNDRELIRYNDELRNQTIREREWEQDVADIILNSTSVRQFQLDLTKQKLRSTRPHDSEDNNIPKGTCELTFKRYLAHHFSNSRIRTGLELKGYSYDPSPYFPDFAYIDLDSKLHIDIEIDEPYSCNSKTPTHYLNAEVDGDWNGFFLKKGWIIIRFAEEQVARYPDSCCKIIAEIICDITGEDCFSRQMIHFKDLPHEKQWSEEEAKNMAINNYKNKYISICINSTSIPNSSTYDSNNNEYSSICRNLVSIPNSSSHANNESDNYIEFDADNYIDENDNFSDNYIDRSDNYIVFNADNADNDEFEPEGYGICQLNEYGQNIWEDY